MTAALSPPASAVRPRSSRHGLPSALPLIRRIALRLPFAVILFFSATFLTFLLLALTPGDPAYLILGSSATPDAVHQLREQLGLDLPLPVRYWNWVTGFVSGDMGNSIFTLEPVAKVIGERLPVTLSLIAIGIIVMPVVGVSMGIFSAVRGGLLGRVLDVISLVGFSLPSFWVAAILLEVFAVSLHWLPAVGYVSPLTSPADWLRSLVLPVAALSLVGTASFARYTRDAMLDVLASEHIRMARANGLPESTIIYRYALKNVAIRVLTLVGLLTVGLLGGTVFVETVFALPGLGSYVVDGVLQKDMPVVQGVVAVFTLIIILVNLVVDLAYTALDPRVRAS